MEHIEEAGIHSGDSACSIPPYSLKQDIIEKIKLQTVELAKRLNVVGLINLQFAVKENEIYILEVNPRASRTVPFVSKAIGLPIAKLASLVMYGKKLKEFNLENKYSNIFAVKEAVFPFNKFPEVDILLGPEMKSTGEVMGIDKDFGMAFAKSQLGAYNLLPQKGVAFISVKRGDKDKALRIVENLIKLNFKILATDGTAEYLRSKNIKCKTISKLSNIKPSIMDYLNNKKIDLVINTSEGKKSVSDSFKIRRAALVNKIPYFTTYASAKAGVDSIKSLRDNKISVLPLQEFN